MPTNRRNFLKASAVAAGALGLERCLASRRSVPHRTPTAAASSAPKASLNILILGGTGFTGPEQVEYAIARGHKVTLINRNKTRPDFFKGRVEQLIGDLNDDMSALKGLKFDVVIDNPTTAPAWVRNAAQYLKGNTKHYIFISTISAYASDKNAWADETRSDASAARRSRSVHAGPHGDCGRYYGPLKAFSEREVEKHYPGMNTIIRPGLIVGPLDRSDRFTYWPYRIDKGGEVLAPGDGNDPGADHRLARPRRVDDSRGGEPHARRVQRDGPGEADDDVRDALRHQSGDHRAARSSPGCRPIS